MSLELALLVWACVLALVYVSAHSFFYMAQVGVKPRVGPRDEMPTPNKLSGRAQRALRNFVETFPVFGALVIVVELGGHSDWLTQWGAGVYLGFRVIYLPLYLSGIPWLRTFSWNFATLGLVLMIVGVFY